MSGRGFTITTSASTLQNVADQRQAAIGLALVRLTMGATFVWVFLENLKKGAYTPPDYAGLINYYIKASHSPAAWKAVMGLMAIHATMADPMQAMTEVSFGIPLVWSARAPGRLCGAGGPSLVRRRMAVTTAAVLAMVVIKDNHVRVSVVIPTHNEAKASGRVLTDLPQPHRGLLFSATKSPNTTASVMTRHSDLQ